METVVAYLKREPVAVLDVVKALLALLIVFGLPIPPGLDVAVAGVVVALLTVVTRGKVSPVQNEEEDYPVVDNSPPEGVDLEGDPGEAPIDEPVPADDPVDEAPDAVPKTVEE